MSIKTNTFDGGVDGNNLTVAGSGGANGDAITNIVIANNDTAGGGPAIKFASSAANKGALGLLITPQSTNTHVRVAFDAVGTRYVARMSFRYQGLPAGAGDLMFVRAGTNGATAKQTLSVNTAGQLYISGLGITEAMSKMPTAMTPGAWYHVEVEHKKGTTSSSTDGVSGYRITDNAGTEVYYYHKDDAVTGTEDLTQVRFGGISTVTGWTTYAIDTIRWGDLTTGWIGPTADALPSVSNLVATPTAPTSVGGTNGKIRLTWDAVAGAVSYEARIASGADATSGWTTVTNANRLGTDFTVPPGVYTYQVRAKAS